MGIWKLVANNYVNYTTTVYHEIMCKYVPSLITNQASVKNRCTTVPT